MPGHKYYVTELLSDSDTVLFEAFAAHFGCYRVVVGSEGFGLTGLPHNDSIQMAQDENMTSNFNWQERFVFFHFLPSSAHSVVGFKRAVDEINKISQRKHSGIRFSTVKNSMLYSVSALRIMRPFVTSWIYRNGLDICIDRIFSSKVKMLDIVDDVEINLVSLTARRGGK